MTSTPAQQQPTVTTRVLDDDRDLADFLPRRDGTLSWVRDGEGVVGWGEAARFTPRGRARFADAQKWWDEYTANVAVRDEIDLPGTGPLAFASFAFADTPGDSALIVPEVLVGRRGGVTWLTTVSGGVAPAGEPVRAPVGLRYRDGQFPVADFRKAVSLAVQRIRHDELGKVVLAHDLLAVADEPLDERHLLTELMRRYPSCWVYAVAGLVGATPEMLLRRNGNTVSARLLAGTAWPQPGATDFDRLSRELLASQKNQGEHGYGVRSLVEALEPFCSTMTVPEPEVLVLPNVAHLATNVTAELREDTSLLRLAERVHPTAAVGGTPTPLAVDVIAELEAMDRGRYAGPVGWIDAQGNGEFGVALRCAQVDGATARLFAGCGIVADSDPDTEAAEAAAKFRAIKSALEA